MQWTLQKQISKDEQETGYFLFRVHNFNFYSGWLKNLVSQYDRRTRIGEVWKESAEDSIRI